MESEGSISNTSEKDNSPRATKRTYAFPSTFVFRDEAGSHQNNKSRIWLKEGDFDRIFK